MSEIMPPWPHQVEVVNRAKDQNNFALFLKPGAGKTRTAIAIAMRKFEAHGRILKTLILTPGPVVPQFRNEWFTFTDLPPSHVVQLTGSGKKRLQTFLKEAAGSESKIFLCNHESLLMKDLVTAFLHYGFELIVFDESQEFKSATAKRAKVADELANPYDLKAKRFLPPPYKYILSGTPVANSPMDLFQQFKILDGGESFGENIWAFRARYFRDRNAGMPKDRYFPKWEIMSKEKDGFDAMAALEEIVSKKSYYADVDKYLPGEQYITVQVGMTDEQAKAYADMKREFVAVLQGGAIGMADLAITKALRLMQIASGFLGVEPGFDEDGEPMEDVDPIHRFEDTPKIEYLKHLLETISEQGEKTLVWAVWKHNYAEIRAVCEKLNIKYVEVHGGVSPKQKLINIKKFQEDPEIKVFIGHPKSGGVGLNLVAASYSIFYSSTFSLTNFEQAKRRNFRGGQKKKVTHYILVCGGTIDEIAAQALRDKQAMSEMILRAAAAS